MLIHPPTSVPISLCSAYLWDTRSVGPGHSDALSSTVKFRDNLQRPASQATRY